MSAAPDGPSSMRPSAAGLLAVLVLGALLVTVAPPPAPGPFAVRGSAAGVAIAIAPDRPYAGRNDTVTFTIWVNVSGSGQFQSGIVNLTFDDYAGYYGNPLLLSGTVNPTWPGSCIRLGPLDWQCFNMRAGYALVWTVPFVVNGSYQRVGFPQNVTANVAASQGGSASVYSNVTSVWIAGATLDIQFVSAPLLSAAPGDLVMYNVTLANVANPVGAGGGNASDDNATALWVNLTIRLDPAFRLASSTTPLTASVPRLTPGSELQFEIPVLVLPGVFPGTVASLEASATYQDFNGHALAVANASAPLYIRAGNLVSTPNLIVAAAIGLAAVVLTVVGLLFMRQRRVVLDEAFLMYRNGVLISHVSLVSALKKDEDLVASMLVAVQDFVKDSFRSESLLDEVSFGGRRAALVRGQRLILVAVVSRGDADSVIPQMLAAVRTIEDEYGPALAAWDGRMRSLAGVEDILRRFLHGGFRSAWRAQLT